MNLPFINEYPVFDDSSTKPPMRDGVIIEKGVVLTQDWVESHETFLREMTTFFTGYPDIFLDIITPVDEGFNLFFYQRIFIRVLIRFTEVYIVACRAASKSFLSILGQFLEEMFFPGSKRFQCAPKKQQGAQIATEKVKEIYDKFPLLKNEVLPNGKDRDPGNFGKDYVKLNFKNKSIFDVVGALETTRGGRRHGGLIDELRDHDETLINEVVLPLLNVSRRLPDNSVNNFEPNQQVIMATSAGSKSSFAYMKLIDTFENSIIDPMHSFVMSIDWRIPVMHGLLDANFVQKLKMSPSYDAESFMREYGSYWSGAASDSWFNFDKMIKYRKLINPEWQCSTRQDSKFFYLISVDVGRLNDATAVSIIKVFPKPNRFYCSLVNLIILGRTDQSKRFQQQAIDLKKIIRAFNPKEVVMDTNGIGVALADEMLLEHRDENGDVLPAYGFINDKNYKKIQPRDSIQILYGIKADQKLNSLIHGNCYARLSTGSVRFLIKEQDAKVRLMDTKIGRGMTHYQRTERLMPHEMTSRLFNEMTNLRLKKTVSNDIILERINTHFPKDTYSSFSYGLWRIKELEDEYQKKHKHNTDSVRRLVFLSGNL